MSEDAKVMMYVSEEHRGALSETDNLELEKLAADPDPPFLGRLWFNTTEQAIKTFIDVGGTLTAVAMLSTPITESMDGGQF